MPDIGIDKNTYRLLAEEYAGRWGVGLCAVDPQGHVLLGSAVAGTGSGFEAICQLAIGEALRWGEPTVQAGPHDSLVWAIPLMRNALVLGGLVAVIAERQLFPAGGPSPDIDIRGACQNLRRLAETHNLTNAALLESRRGEYTREQKRAEAIHRFKDNPHYDLRALYLVEEPMLVAAIRKGDRGEARAIVNRLLVGVIHHAQARLELVKSFFMELVATMCRTAVEAGGAPEELLGTNFGSLSELAAIQSEEKLAAWLHEMLERVMDSIRRFRNQTHPVLLSGALRYMADHCCEDISRDAVAEAAFLSPSHFSRLFKKHLGQSFTDVLNQMRVDRAAELLANSDIDLKRIALDTGFTDQSYFTKVFRRHRHLTPAQYRRDRRRQDG